MKIKTIIPNVIRSVSVGAFVMKYVPMVTPATAPGRSNKIILLFQRRQRKATANRSPIIKIGRSKPIAWSAGMIRAIRGVARVPGRPPKPLLATPTRKATTATIRKK